MFSVKENEDRMVIRLDPRYESIVLWLSLDLVSRRAVPGMHVIGTLSRTTAETWSRVSLDWVVRRRREWMT